MEAERLYHDADLVRFYDLENRWADDFDFCSQLAEGATSVLDLGCGTGLLAASLAVGGQRRVFGVDPAAAMLDIARCRPGGCDVQWVEADARSLQLNGRFDLVLLTGHAFQVFLTRKDRAAVLRTIVRHLAPGGRFVFDTRNPAVAAWKAWTPARSQRRLNDPVFGPVTAWNDASGRHGIVSYETHYRIERDARIYSARARIAFPDREELALLLEEASLAVETWYGDWAGRPFAPAAPEIIPVGTLR